jgi:hypothetical protein
MYLLKTALLASTLLILSGCATNISGTWQGRDSTMDRPFSFGAVTFAPDGTYTAEAKYGETVRAVTGTYSISGDMIMLYGEPFGERSYNLARTDGALIFTDTNTEGSMTLDRYR